MKGMHRTTKESAMRRQRTISLLMLVIILSCAVAQAQGQSPRETSPPKSLDPMNRPMDELGVTGKDDTLCSDRWYSCTTYDRQQFDQKYPGQPLKDLLRYGEPDWPDHDRGGSEYGRDKGYGSGSGDHLHDRFDGD
jgi:hypothetical protein